MSRNIENNNNNNNKKNYLPKIIKTVKTTVKILAHYLYYKINVKHKIPTQKHQVKKMDIHNRDISVNKQITLEEKFNKFMELFPHKIHVNHSYKVFENFSKNLSKKNDKGISEQFDLDIKRRLGNNSTKIYDKNGNNIFDLSTIEKSIFLQYTDTELTKKLVDEAKKKFQLIFSHLSPEKMHILSEFSTQIPFNNIMCVIHHIITKSENFIISLDKNKATHVNYFIQKDGSIQIKLKYEAENFKVADTNCGDEIITTNKSLCVTFDVSLPKNSNNLELGDFVIEIK